MLQYIINASIVWIAALILYEVLLRKERFHQYNRAYLIAGIVAGLLLPTLSINGMLSVDNTRPLLQPVAQVHQLKSTILATPQQASTAIGAAHNYTQSILWALYLIGVLVGIVMIAREAKQLYSLYKYGQKNTKDGYTVVETGKSHGAFSFFKMIFIGRIEVYSLKEWKMLMAHEHEHGRLLHSLDNVLLITLRTLFWFNPLVHIIHKKLRLVHEYQADIAAAGNTSEYSSFVLEQSLLQKAPVLTNSFNYSPIKNRLAMLTRTKTTGTKKLKYLTVFPLLFILILFCTQTSLSYEADVTKSQAYFNGNKIEFGELKIVPSGYVATIETQKKMFMYTSLPDSVPVKNLSTGITTMQAVKRDTMPVAINGKPIYGNERQYFLPDADKAYILPIFTGAGKNLYDYLFSNLKTELEKLEDGSYKLSLDRLVIDEQGNIAYYDNEGIVAFMSREEKWPTIPSGLSNSINKKMVEALNAGAKFKPALKDSKPVNVRMPLGKYMVVVINHKATLVEMSMNC